MIDPSNLRFTRTHEWVRVKGKRVVVGITDYGQSQLSDVVGVELPEPDESHYDANEDLGVLESTRKSSDFHAPIAGTVVLVNAKLFSEPELINSDPYGDGWLIEMKPDNLADVHELMGIHEYEAKLPEDEEE